MSKIIGTFASRDSAESCIRELRNSGFDHNRISLVARESGKKDEGGQGFGATMAGDDTAFGGTATGGSHWRSGWPSCRLRRPGNPGNWADRGCRAHRGTLPELSAEGWSEDWSTWGFPRSGESFYEGKVREGRILAVVDAGGDKVNDAARIMRDYGASDVETH